MAFDRPTLSELIERAITDIETRLEQPDTPVDAQLRYAVLNILAKVHAGGVHGLYGYQVYLAKQVMPDTAESEYLRRWASIWLAQPAKPAVAAQGLAIFTGTEATLIPSGTVVQRLDGVRFSTDADGTITGGSATIAVTAEVAGVDGNTGGGTVLSLVTPIAGINSTATVEAAGITNGVDAETDDSILLRLLTRIRQAPHGGNVQDYVTWALEVAGVTRAWCYPLYFGDGTVGVTFVLDDQVGSIIPDAAKVQEVQDYIDAVRPVTAAVTVFAPTAVPLDLTIALTPNTAAVQAAVQAELESLLRRAAEPGATILWSQLNEAISIAQGETDHVLSVPAADVPHAADEIAVLGTITWA